MTVHRERGQRRDLGVSRVAQPHRPRRRLPVGRATPGDGSGPIDLGIDPLGLYLYTLNSGTESISGFRILPDGSLFSLEGAGVDGLPDGANGLAVRCHIPPRVAFSDATRGFN